MKKVFRTQIGRFISGLAALLLVAAVVTGAQQIPFIKADVSPQKVMTMSEETSEIARNLQEDVDIYYLATETGKELWVDELAQKYAALNSHISYEMVDPASSRATDLASMAAVSLAENSLIVASGDRCISIAADSLYEITYDQMYYYYYGELVPESQVFVADSQLANAIMYVTRDDLPVLYTLTGHGEVSAMNMMLTQLRSSNIVIEELSLDGAAVPEDAAAVMIYAPQSDLTGAEADALLSYLKQGGRLYLMTDYLMEDMPNLEKVAAYYGMAPVGGLVVDMTTGYSYSTDYPQYLQPDVSEHETTATLFSLGAKPTISYAAALERNDVERAGLTVTTLLTTSDAAYMKTDVHNLTTPAIEDGDPVGAFTLAMAASEGDTRVVWYSSGSFLDDTDIQLSSGANLYLMSDTLGWMIEMEPNTVSGGAELMTDALAVPGGISPVLVYCAFFLPALIALAAGIVCGRRKKA